MRLGPPICRPSKIICIGVNYRDHATESSAEVPREPVVFMKATSSLVGPNDPVVIPKNAKKLDWEVELAVVIGKKAAYITKEQALEFVAGYALHNDYSERSFQLERAGQWVKGKNEFGKKSNNKKVILGVPSVVSYVSEFMTLLPGDVISTGTPAGVGLGAYPPQYLKPGDVVDLGIEGLGESQQRVVAWKDGRNR